MSLSSFKCKTQLSPGHVSCKNPRHVTFAPEGEISSSLHSYTEPSFLISHFSLDMVLVSCRVFIIASPFPVLQFHYTHLQIGNANSSKLSKRTKHLFYIALHQGAKMRKLTITACLATTLLTAVSGHSAQDSKIAAIDAAYSACLDKSDGVTANMNGCSGDAIRPPPR
jgi:hypothetical protein